MMNMGLSRLRLVRPAEFDAYRIAGIAHRSEDLVAATKIFDSLEEAVADTTFVAGTTARARTAQRNYVRPRELAPLIIERALAGEVAVLFGREDRGLGNEALDLCHSVAIVPTDAVYSSLNLAQACLLTCYEIFLASQDGGEPLPTGRRAEGPATQADLEETYAALQTGLHSIQFFKGTRSPESVMRTLRTLISRAEPDLHEARLVRAVGFEVGHCVARLEGAIETEGDQPSAEDPDG
ncbi:MAG: tRNA (cytosine(32)/uridine(32)-2'-O)-methyltransferase TrmJ [Gemmatimonadota bacterium]|nr:MAG: tRNA (cytosine(32)/uridine(32)-2'-O)-methyltransferase TrmJ [Gemmatimonadota bacterium]